MSRLLLGFAAAGFFLCAVAASAVAGNAASVEGKVHFKGQPIVAKVTFHIGNSKTTVVTNRQGEYAVKALPAGKAIVTISADGLPAVYASPKTSPLAVELKAGKQMANLELQ